MTEFPEPLIISGPESMDPWHPNVKRALVAYADLTIGRTTYSNGRSESWIVALTKDLERITKGGVMGELPPQLGIDKDYGLSIISGGFELDFDSPEIRHLYEMGVQALKKMGVELPTPNPQFKDLEELIFPLLSKSSMSTIDNLKEGDFVVESGSHKSLVYFGEIGSIKENRELNNLAKIRASRGLTAHDSDSVNLDMRFKGKSFFVSIHHFSPEERHIVGVCWADKSGIIVSSDTAAFLKLDRETFKNIKEKASPLAKKE
ncbi:MAG: hypothetical protein HW400_529 [Candidatus Levybacteria bacterium]|nr:hypothetical protein [Candidatus Levybacteria bacterium]